MLSSLLDFLVSFLTVLELVRVQCGNGRGSGLIVLLYLLTGTFITMNISTLRLADIGTVNVHKTVQKLRQQRAFSIQMPDQYVFCHLALIEHAQREGLIEDFDLTGFEDSSSDSE